MARRNAEPFTHQDTYRAINELTSEALDLLEQGAEALHEAHMQHEALASAINEEISERLAIRDLATRAADESFELSAQVLRLTGISG